MKSFALVLAFAALAAAEPEAYRGRWGGYRGGYRGRWGYGKREAEAEADPALLYSAGLPLTTYGYAGYGLGYTGLGYTGLYGIGKREAEAEPEAWRRGGYGGRRGGYGRGRYGKREADAEPEAEAEADPAVIYGSTLVGTPLTYGYGLGYTGLGYTGLYGIGKREAEAEPEAWRRGGYGGRRGGYGRGRYGKREADAEPEAEAEADPAVIYGSTLVGTPLTYGYGLGYTGLGYAGLGYTGLYGIGKREAEAEPEAWRRGWGGYRRGGYGRRWGKREADAEPQWGYGWGRRAYGYARRGYYYG